MKTAVAESSDNRPRSAQHLPILAVAISAVALTALDIAVVGTAMPVIVAQLHGLHLYSWVFSIYLLASTATVPLFGRLADVAGRKRVFAVAALLFVTGSASCAAAQGMIGLVAFRAVQGLGAGGLLPVAVTLVGDAYPMRQRARIEGLLSAVWGMCAVIGPAVGGLIVQYASWRWIFLLNLPLGVACLAILPSVAETEKAAPNQAIDYLGALLLIGATAALVLGLSIASSSALMVAWLIASGALALAFARRERASAYPMFPPAFRSDRLIIAACLMQFLAGGVLFGAAAFIPLMVQGVMGWSPMAAGLAMAPMSAGWLIASSLSGRLISVRGYRSAAVLGSVLVCAGAAILAGAGERAGLWGPLASVLVLGLGFGFAATTIIVAAQGAVLWGQRGVVTGLVEFFGDIGGCVWVAAMGAIARHHLSDAGSLLDTLRASHPSLGRTAPLAGDLAQALDRIFELILVLAVIGLIVSTAFPSTTGEQAS